MTIKKLTTLVCLLLGTSLFAQAQRDTVHIHIYDTIRVTDRRTVTPPTIISRDGTTTQQINTTAIHKEQTVFDFSTASVDSIVFYRKLDAPIPPIIVITRVDSLLYFKDTLFHQPRLRVVDGRWLTALGIASFATDSTWTVTNGRATQVWSDAVQTHRCSNRTEFNGGTLYSGEWTFNVDCRSNPGFPGDLFSWQAVYALRYELCPYPWRVPTAQDFVKLDIIMGGTGRIRHTTPQLIIDHYITRWGGAFGGASSPNGDLWYQGWWGDYWSLSLSEQSANYGVSLTFGELGTVNSRDYDYRHDGLSLRCIRQIAIGCTSLNTMGYNRPTDVRFTQTPEPMLACGEVLQINIAVSFAPRYFHRNAVVVFQPELQYEGGTVQLRPVVLIGERVTNVQGTIIPRVGGRFAYIDKIPFTPELEDVRLVVNSVVVPARRIRGLTAITTQEAIKLRGARATELRTIATATKIIRGTFVSE